MKGKRFYRGADHRSAQGVGGGSRDKGPVPTARNQRAELLPLKAKYGGMDVSDAKRLKQLEDENRPLKHIVAQQTLEIAALKGCFQKNGGSNLGSRSVLPPLDPIVHVMP